MNYKEFISSEPETSSIQISPQDQYLILTSDGLYKVFSKFEVAQQILQLKREGYALGEISAKIS
jgi:serine/threonine protein phosphatase PrpC